MCAENLLRSSSIVAGAGTMLNLLFAASCCILRTECPRDNHDSISKVSCPNTSSSSCILVGTAGVLGRSTVLEASEEVGILRRSCSKRELLMLAVYVELSCKTQTLRHESECTYSISVVLRFFLLLLLLRC